VHQYSIGVYIGGGAVDALANASDVALLRLKRVYRELFMSKLRLTVLALALLSASVSTASAQQAKVGLLTCYTSERIGLIVASTQKLSCTFTPDSGAAPEHYLGTINRIGPDIGATAGGIMSWAVLAPTDGWLRGALTGEYVGAAGNVAIVVGGGANVLVGGSNRSVALQPLSVEGQVGINLALGVAGLTLTWSD
jgi:hypothetical protein